MCSLMCWNRLELANFFIYNWKHKLLRTMLDAYVVGFWVCWPISELMIPSNLSTHTWAACKTQRACQSSTLYCTGAKMAAACGGNQENLSLQYNSLLIHSSVIGVKLRSQSFFGRESCECVQSVLIDSHTKLYWWTNRHVTNLHFTLAPCIENFEIVQEYLVLN